MADTKLIKELRDKTEMSIKEIKKALEEAGDDVKKALELLRKQGAKIAEKRAERETGEGVIEAYIHNTKKIGALVDIRSETDFVARNEQFRQLAHDIAMQIASMDPKDVDDLLSQPFIKNQDFKMKDREQTLQKLKVAEALQDDVYKGIARVDTEVMRELGIKRGDVIIIKGQRETVAIADRAYPAAKGVP